MSAGTVEAPAGVAGTLQAAREAVAAFQQQVAAAWMVPEDELAAAVADAGRLRAAVEAGYLGLVREVVDRGTLASIAGVAPGTARVASSPEGVVRAVTGASPGRARADVAAAVATAPGAALEQFGTWLAGGDVGREHVDVAVRVMDRIPRHLVEDPAEGPRTRAAVATFLRTVADDGRAGAGDVDRAGRRLLAHLDPDGRRSFDPNADQRRFLDLATDATGMVVGRFQLTAAEGAALRAAIAEYSGPTPGTDDRGRVTPDHRTPRQRRADALSTLIERAMGVATRRRGERPRVVFHLTPQQAAEAAAADAPDAPPPSRRVGAAMTEHGEVLPPWAVTRLSCDAVIQRVVMDPSLGPLDVGREHRLVTSAQRRALAARDGGCVICGAPPDWCDAHHIVPWALGGASDLHNYVLLCPGHHTGVHTGTWQVVRHDDSPGGVLVIPPVAVDPTRRPRPPTHHLVMQTLAESSSGTPGDIRHPASDRDDHAGDHDVAGRDGAGRDGAGRDGAGRDGAGRDGAADHDP